MKYNFDKISQRRNTSSIKWDVKDNELPMWVADMDFMVMPEIQDAIIDATKDASYGYTYPTVKFFLAYQYWWETRHGLKLDIKSMVFSSGVVSALDSLIRTLTKEDDAVMILSPVYNVFYSVIKNNSRKVITSNLRYKNGDFVIDYQDVEDKVKEHHVKLFIFCNPHNPVGKIWSKEEINYLYQILKKHDVMMISDEIHCDIVEPGYKYVPALTVDKDIITCLAPSKVFNLAGLHSAVTVVNNLELKQRIQEAYYKDDIGEPNYFVEPATIAAYRLGAIYVDELNQYLLINKQLVKGFFKDNNLRLEVVSGPATYLLWIDISYYQIPSEGFAKELREQTGLFITEGSHYGRNGKYFIRMNIATSKENVLDGLNRIKQYLNNKE